jgi:hypothetical protein
VGVSAELLGAMDAEHETMAAALRETRNAVGALLRDPGSEQVLAARTCFEKLRSVTVAHLDHEEAELEPVYQEKKDTPEIKAMGRAFGKTAPARGGRFIAWVLDGASPEERAGVTASVPGPVLSVIGGVFGRGYRREIAPVWLTSPRPR